MVFKRNVNGTRTPPLSWQMQLKFSIFFWNTSLTCSQFWLVLWCGVTADLSSSWLANIYKSTLIHCQGRGVIYQVAFQRGGGGKVHPGNLWGEPVLGGRPSGPLPLRPLHKKHRQVVGANLWICSTMTSGVSRSSRESAAASEEMTDNDSWRFWASLKISGQYIMHHNPQKLLSM